MEATMTLLQLWLTFTLWFRGSVQPSAVRTSTPSSNTLQLATFNIRFGWPQDPLNEQDFDQEGPWYKRREGLVDQVIWEEPDVIGFQEVLHNQLDDLTCLLGSSYDHIGVGRDDGKTAGEAVPIFWRTDRVKLLSFQHFWLSEKPEVVGSIGWDAGQTRMATLAHFSFLIPENSAAAIEVEPEEFFVLNTHYDDRGILARTKSSALIVAKLNELMATQGNGGAHNKLVVVLGDLNSPASEDGYRVLTGHRYVDAGRARAPTQFPASESSPITFLDSRHALLRRPSAANKTSATTVSNSLELGAPYGEHSTYTGFSLDSPQTLIDYILLADNGMIKGERCDKAPWRVAKYGVIPNHYGDGVWASDHRMVTVTLRKN